MTQFGVNCMAKRKFIHIALCSVHPKTKSWVSIYHIPISVLIINLEIPLFPRLLIVSHFWYIVSILCLIIIIIHHNQKIVLCEIWFWIERFFLFLILKFYNFCDHNHRLKYRLGKLLPLSSPYGLISLSAFNI